MKFLLDTNVFREIGKTRPDANVAAWLSGVDDFDLYVSALTVREVRKGVERLRISKPDVASAIETRAEAIFSAFDDRVLPITREIANRWGALLAESDKHVDDTGLAATASVHGLILATRNQKHFSGRGVPALDPYRAKARISYR